MQEEDSLRPNWTAAPSDDGHIEDGIPIVNPQEQRSFSNSGSDSEYEPGDFNGDERIMALQARLDAGSHLPHRF
jgi:hypothetical protein